MIRACRSSILTFFVAVSALGAPQTARARNVQPRTRRDDVAGRVVDASGAPISEARVLVVELDRAVLTDDQGRFSLDGLPSGTYTVEVRRPGYRAITAEFTTASSGGLTLTLEEAAFALDPLNVTVARGPLSAGASPLATSFLGAQALERDRSASLAHTLTKLPGVRNLSTGGEIGKPVVRGLSGARVLVLSQGLRLEDYAWSDEDGPAIDPSLVERVEVVRGPASVLYGADAVGGVVNVIPRPLPDASTGSFTRTESEISFGTNNRELGLMFRGEGAASGWGWRAAVTGRKSEALHTPVGELENTGFGAFGAEAAAVRRGEWGSFTIRFVQNGGEFKLLEEDGPPAGGEEEELEEGPERKLSDQRLQLLGNFPFANGTRLETRFQGQRHNIIELEDDPEALARGEFIEVPIYDLTLSTGLGEALLHHSLAPNTSGTVGVTGEAQHSETDGVIPIIPSANQKSAGVFALERATVGRFTVLGGVRAEVAQVDPESGTTRTFKNVTWSAGASMALTRTVSLAGNVGTAWRAPTLFELYASGPRLGEGRYEIGSSGLTSERSLNVDGSLRWNAPRFRGEVAAYRNAFDNFLFIQPTGEVRDGYQVYRYAQAEAVLTGAEASVAVEATPWLTLDARGDWVRGTNDTRDEPLPLMPPRRLGFGGEVHGAWPSQDDRAYLGADVETVAEPDRLNPLDLSVDAYTLVNLSAGVSGMWLGRESSVDVRVRNLGNVSYKDFLSRYKAFALNPGRNVVVRLRMAF